MPQGDTRGPGSGFQTVAPGQEGVTCSGNAPDSCDSTIIHIPEEWNSDWKHPPSACEQVCTDHSFISQEKAGTQVWSYQRSLCEFTRCKFPCLSFEYSFQRSQMVKEVGKVYPGVKYCQFLSAGNFLSSAVNPDHHPAASPGKTPTKGWINLLRVKKKKQKLKGGEAQVHNSLRKLQWGSHFWVQQNSVET